MVFSRGMVNYVFCFSIVRINLVLHLHILSLKLGPCLFFSPTLFLSQCTIFLSSLLLLCIYLLVLISGVERALFPNILPQNHLLTRWNWLADCSVSIVPVFCLRFSIHKVTGVLLGHHVKFTLLVGFHTSL